VNGDDVLDRRGCMPLLENVQELIIVKLTMYLFVKKLYLSRWIFSTCVRAVAANSHAHCRRENF
jgi:hypothetical protein